MQSYHELKTQIKFFKAVWDSKKKFEIRRNDRHFHVGDGLLLREITPLSEQYTGREIRATVEYITDFGQKKGFVVLGIRVEHRS